MSLCIDDRLVCTPNDHLYRVTYTRRRIDTINPYPANVENMASS